MTKRLAAATLLILFVAGPLYADFNAVARAIDSQRGVSRVWIPFLGLARVAVWVARPEGVRDFQLVTFEGTKNVDGRAMQRLVQSKIGPGYTPLVQTWSRKKGEWSFIYAKPTGGKFMELVVIAHDGDETVLVRVDVNADVVAREINKEPRNVSQVAGR